MRLFQKKISLLIVLLTIFIDWMGIGLVYPMFSSMFFHREFQIVPLETSNAVRGLWLGILLSAMPITQFFISPLAGSMSDQKGRKPILKITLLIGVAGYLVAALAIYLQTLVLLLLSRIIIGIAAGSAAVVSAAVADLSTPEEKAKHFGWLSMVCGVGFTIGPFLGGKLSDPSFISWGGFALPFLFSGSLTLLNWLLVVSIFRETHKGSAERAGFSVLSGVRNLKKALHLPVIRSLYLAIFMFCFGWTFYWEFIPVNWIGLYRLGTSEVSNFYAYAAGFYAAACAFLIGPVMKRFEPFKVLSFSLVLVGLYILLSLVHFPRSWLWVYLPPQQCLLALIFPTAAALISNRSSQEIQGEAMGILQSVQAAAFAFSPLLSGAFVGLNIDMPIIVGGIAFLLAALILYKNKFITR